MEPVINRVKILVGKIWGILDKTIDTIATKVSDPRQFLIAVVFVAVAMDILFLGKLGFVKYMVAQVVAIANSGVVLAGKGGWPLVVVLLILAGWKK